MLAQTIVNVTHMKNLHTPYNLRSQDVSNNKPSIPTTKNVTIMSKQAPLTGKRKRTPSTSYTDTTINPFSYTPDQLFQFSIAGLSANDEDPTADVRDFPHRPLPKATSATSSPPPELDANSDESVVEQDFESDDDDKYVKKTKARKPHPQQVHLNILIHSTRQFLSQGEIEKAARSFALLLQLRPRLQQPIDVRKYNLWAVGAEIIMREGETQGNQSEQGDGGFVIPRRWGSAASIKKLRAYFESLVQQYPYDYRYPNKVSAVNFYIAQFSCELYNAYVEGTAALEKVDAGMDDLVVEGNEYARKEEIQKLTVAVVEDLARRMDMVMREEPFLMRNDYLRLRAMVSLYLADLGEGEARQMEMEAARDRLRMIVRNGGKLDAATAKLLEGNEDEDVASHLYASLPIRGMS